MRNVSLSLGILLISVFAVVFLVITGCKKAPTAKIDPGVVAHQADTVYKNGKIYTVNEKAPWAEAVAIKDGKFIAAGSNADVETLMGITCGDVVEHLAAEVYLQNAERCRIEDSRTPFSIIFTTFEFCGNTWA